MAVLGELESLVMGILWAHPESLAVREVHTRVGMDRNLAYTTVMTVLDRLSKKGIVHRRLDGRAWLYSPARTRVELVVAEVRGLLAELAADERVQVARLLADGDGDAGEDQ